MNFNIGSADGMGVVAVDALDMGRRGFEVFRRVVNPLVGKDIMPAVFPHLPFDVMFCYIAIMAGETVGLLSRVCEQALMPPGTMLTMTVGAGIVPHGLLIRMRPRIRTPSVPGCG